MLSLKDETQFEGLTPIFSELGYRVQRSQPYAWKIFSETDSDEIPNEFYTHRYPFCDIFVMRKVKGRYVLRDKTGQNAWPNEYYTESQVENVAERQFGDLSLCCPGEPEEYLERTYGAAWPTVGATHFFCHKSAGLFRQTVFDIDPEHFRPALPFN